MTSAYDQGDVPPIQVKHRLRIAREYAGLDQDQLAIRMEVTRSTISNAENGHGTPRRATINAWAMACGVPATWIKTGCGPDNPTTDKPTDWEQLDDLPGLFDFLRPTG
jgi:transcriptional regulator with XRE-family HTH domain